MPATTNFMREKNFGFLMGLIKKTAPQFFPGSGLSQDPLAKVSYSVIPAKAGIQNCLKILDSGSPPAFAGVARNDGFLLISGVLQEPPKIGKKGELDESGERSFPGESGTL